MGVRILDDCDVAVLYCSTSDIAFGPVFYSQKEHWGAERAMSFLRFLGARDARSFSEKALIDLYGQWLAQEEEQWAREKEDELKEEYDGKDSGEDTSGR